MSFFSGSNKKSKQQAEEIQSLTEEVNKLRLSQSSFKATISENEKSREALEEEIGQLRRENKEMKDKLEPYDQIFNERQDLQKRDAESTIKIKELNSEIKELNQMIETLNDEIKNTKSELHTVKGEHHTDKSKMDEMFQEREGLDSRIDELEKEKCELEDELVKLKEDIQTKVTEEEEKMKTATEEKEKDEKYAKAYLEDLRKELGEYKSKVDVLTLESEALKSENESLFRANESKKKDMDELIGELTSIKNELKIEQQRFVKLKKEWDEEKKRTEFVIVSKSAGKTRKKAPTRPDDEDSEDEHLVSVTEAARAEAEALREKERGLRKRINQLQIDKEELFRSGTNLFAENKSLKNKYDDVCKERNRLLQSESTLQHKLREKDKEIKEMKKTVDDMYYQNLAIKSNEENESKRNAYVVLMGNETVKQLEREKSALNRRVKFLERENHEIEQRVVDLEKQSDALIKYSKKYDKHTPFPPLKGPFDLDLGETTRRTRTRPTSRERGRSYIRTASRERDRYSRSTSEQPRMERPWSNQRRKDDDVTPRSTYRAPSDRQRAQHDYRTDMRPPGHRTRSPDYYKENVPPFVHQSSRQPSFAASNQSHSSRFSFPPMPNNFETQRPDTRSDRRTSRRNSPIVN